MSRHSSMVSCLPGRVRLRHRALRKASLNARLVTALHDLDGVLLVEPDLAVGSLLVTYDTSRCDRDDTESHIAKLADAAFGASVLQPSESAGEPSRPPRRSAAKQVNRLAKIGMLASLPLSLALAAAGRKGLHAVTGGAFTLLLLAHLVVHRRHLVK